MGCAVSAAEAITRSLGRNLGSSHRIGGGKNDCPPQASLDDCLEVICGGSADECVDLTFLDPLFNSTRLY
ncbi:MAG: hypothetical protein OXF23_06810, partial [Candidatus Dadabacteria bacterium]|nr:hypothetical protein [Candidatus Dadabacteria bacterium]